MKAAALEFTTNGASLLLTVAAVRGWNVLLLGKAPPDPNEFDTEAVELNKFDLLL
jgi:hypothetical protein